MSTATVPHRKYREALTKVPPAGLPFWGLRPGDKACRMLCTYILGTGAAAPKSAPALVTSEAMALPHRRPTGPTATPPRPGHLGLPSTMVSPDYPLR